MKVRLKREIVTMGVDDIDPLSDAGAYVEPAAWNALIADPDTVVIDTRNDYEVALGAFRNAVDPGTTSFREFPDWVEKQPRRARRPQDRDVLHRRHTLREGDRLCPLARAVRGLPPQGRHPEISGRPCRPTQSLWQGECFVFDERVSVTHGLAQGEADALPRLPASADGRGPSIAALSRGHLVRPLPRRAQRGRPRPLCRAAAAGATGRSARRGPHIGS